MASDYSRTCASPDSIQTGDTPIVSETCEVYVWGSNSSHQLVEGTQEKILQPKLAPSFSDAQTVSSLHTLQIGMTQFALNNVMVGFFWVLFLLVNVLACFLNYIVPVLYCVSFCVFIEKLILSPSFS